MRQCVTALMQVVNSDFEGGTIEDVSQLHWREYEDDVAEGEEQEFTDWEGHKEDDVDDHREPMSIDWEVHEDDTDSDEEDTNGNIVRLIYRH